MTNLSRRSLITTSFIALMGTAGCGAFDFPRYRSLGFDRVTSVGSREYRVEFEIGSARGSAEWQTFHDVVLVGFGVDGRRVVEHELGDVVASGEAPESAVVSSSAECVLFTFTAVEGPCDADTDIEIARYDTKAEVWMVGSYRECGEGLPPEPLTPTESE